MDGTTTRVNNLFRVSAPGNGADAEAPYGAEGTTKPHLSGTHRVLVLDELPPDVADALRSLDRDGDGTINLAELRTGADEQVHAVRKHHFYRKLFIILAGVWIAQLGAMFGIVFGTVNYAKESRVTDAVMRTKDGLQTVQTAAATLQVPLSSSMSDDAFLELKTLTLQSPSGATMHLTIFGFVRMPGAYGGVTLITHIGRVVLEGSEISYFDDTQAALFEAAGFVTQSGTRRLLQVRALFGVFNAVAAVSASGLNSSITVPPPTLPDAFTMFARRLTPCVPVAGVPLTWSGNYTGGALPRVAGIDYCSLLNIDDEYLLHTYTPDGAVDQRFIAMSYTMIRLGSELLRVEYEHPLVPGQILVEVLDASNEEPVQFSYQVPSGDKGIGLVPHSDGAIPALVGPVAFYNMTKVTRTDLVAEALGAPFDYLGDTTLGGEAVRIWALHLMNNTFTAYWYDTAETREVRRIAFGDFGALDVVSVVPLDGDATTNAHLFMQPEAGTTLMADVDSGGVTMPLPARITLDPFDPFVAAYSMPAAHRRRRLLHTPVAGPDAGAALAAALAGTAGAAAPLNITAAGRGLKQYLGGCASNNKCPIRAGVFPGGGGYGNQAVIFACPAVPVGFMIGPVNRPPCMYEFGVSVSPTQVLIPLPIVITGSAGVSLCNDLSGFDAIYGQLSLAVGIPGMSKPSPLEVFTWQVAAVTLSVVNEVQELQCTVDGGGNLLYDPGDAAMLRGMVSRFGVTTARANCDCLRATGQRTGIGISVGGPDIPGFVLMTIPVVNGVIAPVSPFLAFVKMRPTVSWTYFPYLCGVTRNDIELVISLTLDLVFFRDSINIFDPSFNFLDAYSPVGNIGMELPDWISGPQAISDKLVDAIKQLGDKLQSQDINWQAIIATSTDLKNAATTYFNSASGQNNQALTRIFRPSRVYEYGCFDSRWEGGDCIARLPRRRVFGRTIGGQCYAWRPYTLICGSTQRCIANCR